MSRIGKKEINIPKDVSISLCNEKLIAKGPHGVLEHIANNGILIEICNQQIIVTRKNNSKKLLALHGLTRALLQNIISGVSLKFSKNLIAEGVGYKFQLENKILILSMGYSHPISFSIPNDLIIKLESPTKISISGVDKQKVGLFASQVRQIRPPEPYKGKGIRYENEIIIRKVGKTGK